MALSKKSSMVKGLGHNSSNYANSHFSLKSYTDHTKTTYSA